MPIWKLQRSGILNSRNGVFQEPTKQYQQGNQEVPNLSMNGKQDFERGTKRAYETSSDEENHYEEPSMSPPMKVFKSIQKPSAPEIPVEQPKTVEEVVKRPSVIVEAQQKDICTIDNGDPELEKLINVRLNMVMKLQHQHFETLRMIHEKIHLLNETQNCGIPSISGSAKGQKEEEFVVPEPMQTAAELNTLNQNLRVNPEFREQTVQILVGIGGHDMKQAVRLMMERLVHDNLAAQFSFFGKRGKYTFAAYSAICAVILQSCRRNPRIGEKANAMDLKIHLADCLKNASDRVVKRLKNLHSQYEAIPLVTMRNVV